MQQFTQLFKPGDKPYDFDINQVSYSPKRAESVGFSQSYYPVEQAIVSTEGSKIAKAKTLADLKDAKFGVQIGTTSADVLNATVHPSQGAVGVQQQHRHRLGAQGRPGRRRSSSTTRRRCTWRTSRCRTGRSSGGCRAANGSPEHFGLATTKGSALIPCLNKALSELQADGTLKQLQDKWINGSAPPVLQ